MRSHTKYDTAQVEQVQKALVEAGGMLFVAMVGLVVFANMARSKRSQHGTYNPQKQEIMAPRMELNYMLKPPIEERLI